MFSKSFTVDPKHIDFQGVVDGLYYPFYMEWTRHEFMRTVLGIDIEQLFEQGQMYIVVEYSLQFRKSLKRGDMMEVTCKMERNVKPTRINFVQSIMVDGQTYAEATFVCTCLYRGRPTIPQAIFDAIDNQ